MERAFTRKAFLMTAGISAVAASLGSGTGLAQSAAPSAATKRSASPADELPDFPENGPQLERTAVKRFVVAAHVNFEIVRKMHAAQPELINATWDWGKGDFETALGAASHMGRRDIAEFLLANNARLDVFAAAMLGRLQIVRAAVEVFPGIVHVPGPHGIPLLAHAVNGGEQAIDVVEFLRPLVKENG